MTAHAPTEAAVRRTLRVRHLLILLLTINAGATDAIGFIALGEAFTSVMTGNLVLLGISVAGGDGTLAAHVLAAVICYVCGCVLGARLVGEAGKDREPWPRVVTLALAVELAIFVVTAAVWWTAGSAPVGIEQLVILGGNALALGIQSSSVLRFGVNGLSTTYMTGMLTKVITSLVNRRKIGAVAESVRILSALIVGGLVGAFVVDRIPVAAPLIQLVLLTVVLVCSLAARRRPARA